MCRPMCGNPHGSDAVTFSQPPTGTAGDPTKGVADTHSGCHHPGCNKCPCPRGATVHTSIGGERRYSLAPGPKTATSMPHSAHALVVRPVARATSTDPRETTRHPSHGIRAPRRHQEDVCQEDGMPRRQPGLLAGAATDRQCRCRDTAWHPHVPHRQAPSTNAWAM